MHKQSRVVLSRVGRECPTPPCSSKAPPSALVWQWAANLINPGIYDYDAEQTIRDFFTQFSGYTLSDAQLKTILHQD